LQSCAFDNACACDGNTHKSVPLPVSIAHISVTVGPTLTVTWRPMRPLCAPCPDRAPWPMCVSLSDPHSLSQSDATGRTARPLSDGRPVMGRTGAPPVPARVMGRTVRARPGACGRVRARPWAPVAVPAWGATGSGTVGRRGRLWGCETGACGGAMGCGHGVRPLWAPVGRRGGHAPPPVGPDPSHGVAGACGGPGAPVGCAPCGGLWAPVAGMGAPPGPDGRGGRVGGVGRPYGRMGCVRGCESASLRHARRVRPHRPGRP